MDCVRGRSGLALQAMLVCSPALCASRPRHTHRYAHAALTHERACKPSAHAVGGASSAAFSSPPAPCSLLPCSYRACRAWGGAWSHALSRKRPRLDTPPLHLRQRWRPPWPSRTSSWRYFWGPPRSPRSSRWRGWAAGRQAGHLGAHPCIGPDAFARTHSSAHTTPRRPSATPTATCCPTTPSPTR